MSYCLFLEFIAAAVAIATSIFLVETVTTQFCHCFFSLISLKKSFLFLLRMAVCDTFFSCEFIHHIECYVHSIDHIGQLLPFCPKNNRRSYGYTINCVQLRLDIVSDEYKIRPNADYTSGQYSHLLYWRKCHVLYNGNFYKGDLE